MNRVDFSYMRRGGGGWAPPSGLLAWWSATLSGAVAGGGSWADQSGNGHAMTVNAALEVLPGVGLDWNEVDYLSQSTGYTPTAPRSLAFWLKCDLSTVNAYCGLAFGMQGFNFWFYITAPNLYAVVTADYGPVGTIVTNTWIHLGLVMTPIGGGLCSAKAYLDGVPSVLTASVAIPADGQLMLNSYGSGRRWLVATADELMVFNTSLSDAEMLSIYGNPYAK